MKKETIPPLSEKTHGGKHNKKWFLALLDVRMQPLLLILITIAFLLAIRYIGLKSGDEYKLVYAICVTLVFLLLLASTSGPASRRIYYYGKDEKGLVESANISLDRFLPLATKVVDVYSGELNSHFYNRPNVVDKFKELVDKGVTVNCVYGPMFDIETVEFAKMAVAGKINLFQLDKRDDNEVHFRMVDKKHISHDLRSHPVCGGYVGGRFDINPNDLSKLYFRWKLKKIWKNARKVNILSLANQTVKLNNNKDVKWFGIHDSSESTGYRYVSREEIIEFISKINPHVQLPRYG